ncbi:MAG: ATP-dependent Clp protease ATP-binding subunit [Prevotella sp.]|nr:ATP-dependent Clp protease ATP-binding subunit [Prevotella sp.]
MNSVKFSREVTELFAYSREEASRLYSTSVAPEHLLIAILRGGETDVNGFFQEMNVDLPSLKHDLEQRVKRDENTIPTNARELVMNEDANNVMRRAILEATLQHSMDVEVKHILLAILHDQMPNGAKDSLEQSSVTYDKAARYFQQAHSPAGESSSSTLDSLGVDEPEEDEYMDSDNGGNTRGSNVQVQSPASSGGTPVLDNFSHDLTKAAREHALDPVVGREEEMLRVTEILCRRKKNNPVLIGEPGVGKSAIVEGLAQMIVQHKTSPLLFNKRVVSLDMASVVAGTKYRGQFEERIKAILNEMEQHPEIIVFMDEIHTIIGAGSAPGSMDAANILKPALARGTIQCIGATTLDEYRKSIEKDGALERRFQKVLVEPTTTDETLQILQNIKGRYEDHHHVTYSDEAIRACVKLTERYVTDRSFPDKAIDALDESGAKVHLKNVHMPPEIGEMEKEIVEVKKKKTEAVKNQNFELAASYRDRQSKLEGQLKKLNEEWSNGSKGDREMVTEADVADVVSVMTGVPLQRLEESEGSRLRKMASVLKEKVVAQDAAIDKMVKAIQRNRIGLKDPNRPIGVFMFLGPTGVGKTYLAKQLAEYMFGSADDLIRVDMSEYTEAFNVSRLVGSPPGYVGYDEGGQLTEKVRRHPYSIVLLDEIEKAHGNVFNLLLQVLDEGRLTDGNGRLVDFRNTIIIMTSNAGTRQLKEFGRGVGFNASSFGLDMNDNDRERARSIIQKSLSRQFAPEFLNRLDEIIMFDQLDMDAIKRIVDIELIGLQKRMEDLGVTLHLTDAAKEFLAKKGYDVQFGARPLKRALQNHVEDKVCEMLLEDNPLQGDVKVDVAEGSEQLTFNKE